MLMVVAARRPDGSFLPAVEKEIQRPETAKNDQKLDSFARWAVRRLREMENEKERET